MKANIFYFFTIIFCTSIKAQTIEVKIDLNNEFQQIEGFGASDAWRAQFVGNNWPEAKKEKIAELLFSKENDEQGNPKGIGLSIWRFYISAGTAEQGENSGIQNEWRRGESFVDQNGNYDWSKQEGQQWFLQKAKNYGVEKFLAFSIAAPVFWADNNKGWNNRTDGNLNLKAEFYDDYANFLVEFLDHFKREGISFDYLSPINEPQWDWEKATQEGTPATNENISELVELLDSKISKNDLKTEIIIPEAADLRYLYSDFNRPKRGNQIEDFFGSKKNKETYVGNLKSLQLTVSGHSYFTTWPVDSLIRIRQDLNQSLKKNNLGYWQSEFCILEKNDDIGGGGIRDLGMGTALYVARVIHADLTLANAKSWQWWTALTIADFKDGLIYLDTGNPEDMYNRESLKYDGEFHDSKLLWALGNFSRFVKPGMQRISADLNLDQSLNEQYEDIMVSAYKDSITNELVIVAINYSENPKTLQVNNREVTFEKVYETSTHKNLALKENKGRSIEILPRSIITITGTIKNQ
ncbi:glycoside hydrolase [Zunongwangia atlantica]|uniref:Beta-glycosidase n=1 Tax=Zunongwangia atlantica 22II14-10F7 TaxID=1185767 RepID=A0A1Y1T168_9FLAO|nr:glycoside hydrolase [Zunongwangia atlantica]ORL44769.1 beta-glycosidase [Zunongwangia atlantica 22II14-10F7]